MVLLPRGVSFLLTNLWNFGLRIGGISEKDSRRIHRMRRTFSLGRNDKKRNR
jgi:hypothetical protein